MECHLVRNYRLTRNQILSELEEMEPVFVSDMFGVHLMSCRRCGKLFIFCFRKITTADWKEESWAFWVPVLPIEVQHIRTATRLNKVMADLVATRPHIVMDPKESISWSNTGNAAVGFSVFAMV